MESDKKEKLAKLKEIIEKNKDDFEGINTIIYERQDEYTDIWIDYFTKNDFVKYARAFYLEQLDKDELKEVREKTFSILSYDMLNLEQIKQSLTAFLYLDDYKKAADLLFILIRIQNNARNYKFEEKEQLKSKTYRRNVDDEIEQNVFRYKDSVGINVDKDFRAINWIFQKYEEIMTELNKMFNFKMDFKIDILREFDNEDTIKFKDETINKSIEILENLQRKNPEIYEKEHNINRMLEYFIGKKNFSYRFAKEHIEAVMNILPNEIEEYQLLANLKEKLEEQIKNEYEIAKNILYRENIIADINSISNEEKLRIKHELLEELRQTKKQIEDLSGDKKNEHEDFFRIIDSILDGNLNYNYSELKILTNTLFNSYTESDCAKLKEQLNFNINKINLLTAKEKIDNETFAFFYKKIITKKYSRVYYMSKFDRDFLLETLDYMQKIVIDSDSGYIYVLKLIDEILNKRDDEIKDSHLRHRESLYKFIRMTLVKNLGNITNNMIINNKELIESILRKFIENGKYYYAFELLFRMGVRDYFNFFPKDKDQNFYIEKLFDKEKMNDSMIGYDIKETLCAPKIKEENPGANEIELKILYFQFLEKDNIKTNILLKYIIYNIIKFLREDIDLFEKYPYLEEKANEMSKLSYMDVNSYVLKNELIKFFIEILERDTTIQNKRKLIDKFSKINIFRYKKENETIYMVDDNDWSYNEIIQKTEKVYKQLISDIKQEDIDDLLYIYMNTPLKEIIPLEDLIQDINIKNIITKLNKYKIYARVLKNRFKSYRLKISNIKNNIFTDINKNIVNLPRNLMEGEIVEIKIKGNIFSELVYDITEINEDIDYNQYYDIIDEYFENYNNPKITYILDNSITSIMCLEKNVKYYISKQLDLIDNIDKNIISKLQKDILGNIYNYNRYMKVLTDEKKYIENYNNAVYVKNQLAIIGKIKEISKLTQKYKEDFYPRAINLIKKMLNNQSIKTIDVINVYMNTCLKNIVSLTKFIKMLIDIRGKQKKLIFEKLFSKYVFLYSEDIFYKFFYISDFKNNRLVTRKAKRILIPKVSLELIKVNKMINKYVFNLDEMNFKEISKLPQAIELIDSNKISYAYRNLLLDTYMDVYKRIVINNIQDKEQIKLLRKFIEALGKNNLWRDNSMLYYCKYIKIYFPKKEIKEEVIKIFCKTARTADLDDILYIYKNTWIKNVVDLNKVLRNAIWYNSNNMEKLNDDIFDLKKYQLKLDNKKITGYNFNTEEFYFE